MKYSIGDFVQTDHFNNGICQVLPNENLIFSSISSNQINQDSFVTLKQLSSGITLVCSISKIFPLNNIDDFEATLDTFNKIEVLEFSRKYTWNKRYNELSNRLKNNQLESKLFCLKQLLSTPTKSLCFGERRLIEQLVQHLAVEYSIIKNCELKEAFLLIKNKLQVDLSWIKYA